MPLSKCLVVAAIFGAGSDQYPEAYLEGCGKVSASDQYARFVQREELRGNHLGVARLKQDLISFEAYLQAEVDKTRYHEALLNVYSRSKMVKGCEHVRYFFTKDRVKPRAVVMQLRQIQDLLYWNDVYASGSVPLVVDHETTK